MKKAVIGFVATQVQAEAIVTQLRADGISPSDISVLMPDKRNLHEFTHDRHTKAPEGEVIGSVVGGFFVGALGLLAGIGALAIPGLGPLIAAGPIMGGLSGIGAGSVVGGVVGALVGSGIPEYEAKFYEARLRDGNILLAVHTENTDIRRMIVDTFKRMGVKDVTTQTEAHVPRRERTIAK
jgi:hypothetical protein